MPLYRCLMTFMMLSPCTPLLFMGQEFASSSPFPFFADIPRLEEEIYGGRRAMLIQFPTYAGSISRFPRPCRWSTFRSARLDHSQRRSRAAVYRFHRDLIALRKRDPVIALQSKDSLEGAVLGGEAFALRFNGGELGERLLLVNYGRPLLYAPVPEPLLACGAGEWRLIFSSDDPAYGGNGRCRKLDLRRLQIPGACALFFQLDGASK